MAEKKFGCIMYEDVFTRLDEHFDDNALGRILRAAYRYGFWSELPNLSDGTEDYACSELMGVFDRNRDSYDKQSKDGQISAAIRYAKTEDDLIERLHGIEGIVNHEIFEAKQKWKDKRR